MLIDVEGIRKALEPYREDLGVGCFSICALGRIGGSDDEEELRYALRPYGLMVDAHPATCIEDNREARRIINANDDAPDGFARYQAVMAEVEKIRAEQEAERSAGPQGGAPTDIPSLPENPHRTAPGYGRPVPASP